MGQGETEGSPYSDRTKHEGWRSPAGLSAIAGLLAVVVALAGLFVARGSGDETTKDTEADKPANNLIFVYGSSMPGKSRYSLIERFVESAAEDSVPGLLYDSGVDYPLAKFGPGDDIYGYVLTLYPDSVDEALKEMTAVESGLFHPVQVRTNSGKAALAYEWIGATDGLERIDSPWDGE